MGVESCTTLRFKVLAFVRYLLHLDTTSVKVTFTATLTNGPANESAEMGLTYAGSQRGRTKPRSEG